MTSTKQKKSTPSKRVRARRRLHDPSVYTPPLPPLAMLTAEPDDLVIYAGAARVRLDRAVTSVPWELTMAGASTLTVNLIGRDEDLWTLLDVDEDAVLDGDVIARVGTLNFRLQAVTATPGAPPSLTFIDEVAWQCHQDNTPLKFSRSSYTRAQAIYRMVDQARQPPRPKFPIYIPELNDRQPIAKPTDGADGTAGGDPGFPDDATVKVKGKKATSRQRAVLGAALAEATKQGCSERVMIAVVMALTQESGAGADVHTTGDDDTGVLQQGRNWISLTNVTSTEKAVRAFLLGPDAHVGGNDPNVKGWKQRHGSLRRAPGDLNAAIVAVQISSGGYGQWEDEARDTVKAFNPDAGSTSSGSGGAKTYEFTRGTSEGAESTWTATGRLASEANGDAGDDGSWHRWAVANAFWFASDDELRQAKPSIVLHNGAPWLLDRSYVFNVQRPITEMTVDVLAQSWGLLPGSVAAAATTWGPLAGRWLVRSVRGTLGSPKAEVTLRRPVAKGGEPAAEQSSSDTSDSSSGSLREACEHISSQGRSYLYGGGHGKALSQIGPSEPLDCSSSVSLALRRAGMFNGSTAITSGVFATSWGNNGKGEEFTVYANGEHVWISFSDGSRFDTSPHGDGPSGPRLRSKPRNDEARFTPRHWPSS